MKLEVEPQNQRPLHQKIAEDIIGITPRFVEQKRSRLEERITPKQEEIGNAGIYNITRWMNAASEVNMLCIGYGLKFRGSRRASKELTELLGKSLITPTTSTGEIFSICTLLWIVDYGINNWGDQFRQHADTIYKLLRDTNCMIGPQRMAALDINEASLTVGAVPDPQLA